MRFLSRARVQQENILTPNEYISNTLTIRICLNSISVQLIIKVTRTLSTNSTNFEDTIVNQYSSTNSIFELKTSTFYLLQCITPH